MKKLFKTAAILAASVSVMACSTINRQAVTTEIKSEHIVLNTILDRSDFSIIGVAEGASDFVYYDSQARDFAGDSGKYGIIYESAENFLGQTDNGDKMYVGTGRKLQNAEISIWFSRRMKWAEIRFLTPFIRSKKLWKMQKARQTIMSAEKFSTK